MNFFQRLINPLNVASIIVIVLVTISIIAGSGRREKAPEAPKMSKVEMAEMARAEKAFESVVAVMTIEDMISPVLSKLPLSTDVKRYDHNAEPYFRPTMLTKVEIGEGRTLNVTFGDDAYFDELNNPAVKFTADEKNRYLQGVIQNIHPGLNRKLDMDKYTVNVTVTRFDRTARQTPVKYSVRY